MRPVRADVSFPKLEEDILARWKEKKIFEQSTSPFKPEEPGQAGTDAPRKSFVFYDGPPFATGLPHYGHLLAGTIKDVVGRFFTMKGYHVDRRFGWDCHGVPVEFEIQKSLDLYGAKAIKEFGIGNFNEECRNIVLRFTKEWEQFVKRSGRFVDFNRQYRTMDLDFMESIWWVVKSLWDRGLIYQSVKCVPYSPAINTPLSNFEANLNYKNVQDPAITVRFKLRNEENTFIYAWTTTPWTLPSNMALAVGSEIDYAVIKQPEETVIVAKTLMSRFFPEDTEVSSVIKGKDLVGKKYEPLFPYFKGNSENAFQVYAAEFVSDTDGTGIVHLASFGEDDLSVFLGQGIPVFDPVDEDGRFTEEVTDFAGKFVKDADKEIIAALKKSGKLVNHTTIEHSYPYCWRTGQPLIYKSIPSWFVRVESFRDELVQMNAIVHWVPEHIRDGRMGKWLESARDWAISRNRYWGTPLPIWKCRECDTFKCLGSVSELTELTGAVVNDLHRHFIDDLEINCSKPGCAGKMQRIPEVLDCWFESGAMPYAQAHYPFEGKEKFEKNFPADFIAEGLDQTRGWFYTLLVLSTALFGRPAFKNVIVNGIVLAEDGKKMSKSLKNYPPPSEVFDEIGADAMRLYLLSSGATRAEELRFSKEGLKQILRQTLIPLWNAYNFFVTYALVDKWETVPSEPSPNLLDRWILSKTASLIEHVDTAISNYHLYAAVQPILEFVDQLTNWYIRLNRRRFWSSEDVADKNHAYATLRQVLVSFTKVLAPIAPFVSDEIFSNLTNSESVHLTSYPKASDFAAIDANLEEAMEIFEEVILLGRTLRNDNNVKVRQPLSKLLVIHSDPQMLTGLKDFEGYIKEELNIKSVEFSSEEEKYVSLSAQLNTKLLGKTLGPVLGSDGMKRMRAFCEALETSAIRSVEGGGHVMFEGHKLGSEELLVKRVAKGGASASSGRVSVVLDTTVTRELRLEGFAREFVNRIQRLRKEKDFEVSDRILIYYMTGDSQLSLALSEYKNYVQSETLAVEFTEVESESELRGAVGSDFSVQDVEGKRIVVSICRIQEC